MCGSTGHNFRNIDAVVSRDMLVAESAGYAEAKALSTFDEFDLDGILISTGSLGCVYLRVVRYATSYFLK